MDTNRSLCPLFKPDSGPGVTMANSDVFWPDTAQRPLCRKYLRHALHKASEMYVFAVLQYVYVQTVSTSEPHAMY